MEDTNVIAWSRYVQEQAAPLISIVIPIYNLATYLPRCLDSITQQKLGEIEIVAVDGGSQDASVDVLRERSLKDPRLTVVCAGRIGPGRARNAGAEIATGDYLWFVDGDDLISADCLTAIADKLEVPVPTCSSWIIKWRGRTAGSSPEPGMQCWLGTPKRASPWPGSRGSRS